MIKYNDRFTMEPDQYQWVLVENYTTSGGKTRNRRTYHADVAGCLNKIIDMESKDCTSLGELSSYLKRTKEYIEKELSINVNMPKVKMI